MSNKIFITGTFKTATSSMLAAINKHPDFYMMFELFDTPKMRKRFLQFYPDATFVNKNLTRYDLYSEAEKFLKNKGFSYKYFGDKVAVCEKTLDYNTICELHGWGDYAIFMVRDLEYWSAKMTKQIEHIKYFSSSGSIAEMIGRYVLYFLYSYKVKFLHIKTEDLISGSDVWLKQVSDYTGEDFSCAKEWWKHIDYPGKNNPKRFNAEFTRKKHKSSVIKPGQSDTTFTVSDHKFWDEIKPIFNKYYDNLNDNFHSNEVQQDIISVHNIIKKYDKLERFDLFKHVIHRDLSSGRIIHEFKAAE